MGRGSDGGLGVMCRGSDGLMGAYRNHGRVGGLMI
jgi:hypothetical protein